METGAITQYIDVAQIVLYMFWAFFAGLIYYLVRESHREGYPMDSGRENGPKIEGWPPVPEPVSYKTEDGHTYLSPDLNRPDGEYSAQPTHRWNGAPLEPVGDPLLAGVGPGAWAMRADVPDMEHGHPKIVPMRIATDHSVAKRDVDPRGLPVWGADKIVAGTVVDLWVDRMEMVFRYAEVQLVNSDKRVLLPMNFARIKKDGSHVQAILAHQFANVPQTKSNDQITLLEEEKITAYYGAGTLYATPDRQEPII
jgi:photosynthetic reaction center H subunit